MNNLHDLFLLMFNLSQMNDKAKVIEFFHESISELFKPHQFIYSEHRVSDIAYSEEISTRNFFYGYLLSASEPTGETKQLLQNAIQMLAVVLDRLNFEAGLKEKVDSLETISQQQLSKIISYVEELEIARLASLDLIEDLKEEIKERKQTVKALAESQERLNFHYEVSPLANIELDSNFVVTRWTGNAENIFGWKESETLGKYLPDLNMVYVDDIQLVEKTMEQLLNGSTKTLVSSNRNCTKNGKVIHCVWYNSVLKNTEGKIVSVMSRILDITEQTVAEAMLRETQAILQAAMDQSPAGIAIANAPNGDLRYVNKAGLFIGGGDNKELIKNIDFNEYVGSWNILGLDGVPLKPDEVPLARAILFGEENSREFIIRRAIGDDRMVFANAAPIRDGNGKVIAGIVVFLDITARKQSEEELLRSQERFDLAMKASTDGLFDWNLETNNIYYAPAWKKMLGYEDHELPNDFSVWETTTDPEDVKKSWELQQKLISNQIDRFVLEFKMKHKDGHWVDILSRAEAIFNDSGKAIRIVGTHTDITERKQAEEEIKKQLDELRRWYAAMLDREDRILELKNEVNHLSIELGLPSKYTSVKLSSDNSRPEINVSEPDFK